MDTQQILETIKTLNLNINSDSAVQITKYVLPYFWTELVMTFIEDLLLIGIAGMVVYFAYKYGMKKAEK